MKETSERILEIGVELIAQKGFNNVGIQEILAKADIPKGSFYYYFKSKEDFGIQVISYYSEKGLLFLKKSLSDTNKNPVDRIVGFFEFMKAKFHTIDYSQGCLIGNCCLELSDIKDTYSLHLASELDKWQSLIEFCITEAKQSGLIQNSTAASDLAAFIINSWQGALLRMKATKSPKSLDLFIDFLKGILK